MDLLAALALVAVIEGLAILILAGSVAELMASLGETTERERRIAGLVLIFLGSVSYLAVRG